MNEKPTPERNTMKYTPGPWAVVDTKVVPSRAVVVACDGGVDIYNAPLTAETEANAHLIAAAPDLLEALDQLAWLTWESTLARPEQWDQVLADTQTAIAKARP